MNKSYQKPSNNEINERCLHGSPQSDSSPGHKLFIRENWWNVISQARAKVSSRGNDGFPRVLWNNFSFQGYLILRARWQHQDGEKTVT